VSGEILPKAHGMKFIFIDTNCSWIQSLATAVAATNGVVQCRVYSPLWLPTDAMEGLKMFRTRHLGQGNDEIFAVVPGWRRFPKLSAWTCYIRLRGFLASGSQPKCVIFTFPFYSPLARLIRRHYPSLKIVYHAHDPFEFYSYPRGYIHSHEDAMVSLCDQVFAISDRLRDDFTERYPTVKIATLGNAVSESFLGEMGDTDAPAELKRIRSLGRPVIGCVGQINSSYDWGLLEECASANPQSNFVFIGNLFEEGDVTERIRAFFARTNVHWLGAKPHDQLKNYMGNCDILLNPLARNSQNDRRDTLRLYDYLSTRVPVFSTPIRGARRHGQLVWTPSSSAEMIRGLAVTPEPITKAGLEKRRTYLVENTWSARAQQLVHALLRVP